MGAARYDDIWTLLTPKDLFPSDRSGRSGKRRRARRKQRKREAT